MSRREDSEIFSRKIIPWADRSHCDKSLCCHQSCPGRSCVGRKGQGSQWNRSFWPCSAESVTAYECHWTEHPGECLGKQVLDPSFMGNLQLCQSLLPSILSPIQALRVVHFGRGERHFQNNLCCFLNKTKSEQKQNVDFVITNNDCDTYLLPRIKNHPAVAYGQTELTPKCA